MAEEYFLDGDDGEQDITHNLLFNSKMLDENEICSNNCTVVEPVETGLFDFTFTSKGCFCLIDG